MADRHTPDDPFDALFGGSSDDAPAADQSPVASTDGQEPTTRRAARERTRATSPASGRSSDGTSENTSEDENGPGLFRPDSVFSDDETRSHRRRRDGDSVAVPTEKRSRKGLIAGIVITVILAALVGGGVYAWMSFETQIREAIGIREPIDYEGNGSGEVLVEIEAGQTGTDIAQTLADAGVTKTSEAFYDIVVAQPTEPTFQPGVFRLAKKMSAQSALDALLDPANKIERTALIREGLSGTAVLEELSTATEIPLEEFLAAVADPTQYGVPAGVPSLEGWLFPAQYTFDPGVTATDVIRTLVNRTIQSLDAAGVPVEERERVLTLASVIQREARLEEDFYKVSRVIQNRVDQGMKLEMDSTAQYGIQAKNGWLTVGEGETVWSTAEALSDTNDWNTYTRAGLPVGPISNPGDVAIKAAMSPADGPWIFFVTVNLDTGETVFSETIEQHDAAIAQLRRWCKENPGGAC